MHLLKRSHTHDFELETFTSDDNVPPYAILSHTWNAGQEVTYQELCSGNGWRKAGFDKICFCADQAAQDGLTYFWVDTCCIDKTSSAELQEAINSMFKWYENARICYVYLSDVTNSISIEGETSQFHTAKWHSRGWTLQELLAPSEVQFYTSEWKFIGTKGSLCKQLSVITRIPENILLGMRLISSASVAQRMSWASKRETSRPEDMAYCMMGLFSVNMTMLYGEGSKAFLRLQEEILRETDDHSIFAWRNDDDCEAAKLPSGLLAQHPRHFGNSSMIVDVEVSLGEVFWNLHHSTSQLSVGQGIHMKAHLLTVEYEIQILVLKCGINDFEHTRMGRLGIFVCLAPVFGLGSRYIRLRPDLFTLSRHVPHSYHEITLAKTGSFRNYSTYDIDLQSCQYKLETVAPAASPGLNLELAPIYVSGTNSSSWTIIAWTALQQIHKLDYEAEERKRLGSIVFRADDGSCATVNLAIRQKLMRGVLLPVDNVVLDGEFCCAEWSEQDFWYSPGEDARCGAQAFVTVHTENLRDSLTLETEDLFYWFTSVIRFGHAEYD